MDVLCAVVAADYVELQFTLTKKAPTSDFTFKTLSPSRGPLRDCETSNFAKVRLKLY